MKRFIIILLSLFSQSSYAVDILEGALVCGTQKAMNHYYFLQRTMGTDDTNIIMEKDAASGGDDFCIRSRKKFKGAILIELGPTTKVKIKDTVLYVQGSYVFNIQ